MDDENLVFKEFINVMNNTDKSITKKIPKNIMNYFERKAEKCKKEVYFEKGKSLYEQNISDECKKIISMMYYKYVINEDAQKELMDKWVING